MSGEGCTRELVNKDGMGWLGWLMVAAAARLGLEMRWHGWVHLH